MRAKNTAGGVGVIRRRFSFCALGFSVAAVFGVVTTGCASSAGEDEVTLSGSDAPSELQDASDESATDESRSNAPEQAADSSDAETGEAPEVGPRGDTLGPPVDLAVAATADVDEPPSDEPRTQEADPGPRGGAEEPDVDRDRADWSEGRPEWWIRAAERRDGRIFLAAEALGADVLAARRSAVDAGWAALERAMDDRPRDFRVEKTFLRRLSGQARSERSAQYIGYVLISAASDDAR